MLQEQFQPKRMRRKQGCEYFWLMLLTSAQPKKKEQMEMCARADLKSSRKNE
jgi:hypothetical protein